MHDVFISYSSKNKTIADTICHYFESKGIKCWYAPRDIPPGVYWTDAIMEAIENTKCFLLIYSKESNQSRQVLNEITAAFDASCPIVPFRIDDVGMTKSVAYYLNSVHWLDAITPPLTNHLPILYETVSRVINVVPEIKPIEESDILSAIKQREEQVHVSEIKKKRERKENAFLLFWKRLGKLKIVFIIYVLLGIYVVWDNIKVPKMESNLQNMSEVIMFEDLSWFDKHTYPFYGMRMFSMNKDMYFVQDRETKALSLIKTDTTYPIIENISYYPEKMDSVYTQLSDDYNIIYFIEQNENILEIKLYDKKKNVWISEEDICLQLLETENLYWGITNRREMSSDNEHLDEVLLLIYDSSPDKQCFTKAINIYSNAAYEEYDISQYKFKEVICGIDKVGEHCILMLTDTFEIKVFDFVARQPLELTMQQVKEMYLPYISDNNNRFSSNGRYLYLEEVVTDGVSKATIWDLEKQKSIYSQTFTRNHDIWFQGDSTLLIFNEEDASLQSYDFETERKTLLLDATYFLNEEIFPEVPFLFSYSEKLNACFFVCGSYDDEAQSNITKLVMTGLDGTILAESIELKHSFEKYNVELQTTEDMLFLVITAMDSTFDFEDGISTYIFRAKYSVDENGKVEFY